MKKYFWITVSIVGLLVFGLYAGESSENSLEIGAFNYNNTESSEMVSEYKSAPENVQGSLKLGIMSNDGDTFYKLNLDYMNEDDVEALLEIHKSTWFKSKTKVNRYLHRMGTDSLNNINFKEEGAGKFATHEDATTENHEITNTEFEQVFEFVFGSDVKKKVELGFKDRIREGYEQRNSINHCDNCHTVARSVKVDEQTQDGWVKFEGKTKKVKVNYKFNYSRFRNDADSPHNHYDKAQHPGPGPHPIDSDLNSRMIYSDETLSYGSRAENRKTTHTFRINSKLNDKNYIVGNLRYDKTHNKEMNLDLETKSGSARWSHSSKNGIWKLDTLFSYYTIDNESFFVDLPYFREGQPGGGSTYEFNNFDFNRLSAYDRDVSEISSKFRYNISDNQRLTAKYRLKDIKRDYLTVSENNEDQSLSNRLKIRWDGRFMNGKLRTAITANYEHTDQAFANVGIMENSDNLCPLPGQPKVWYWQREAYGEATNQPTQEWKLNTNLTYKFKTGHSVNLTASHISKLNDDLNTYEWEESSYNAGFHYFGVLSDTSYISTGYDFGKTQSDALMVVPVMDG